MARARSAFLRRTRAFENVRPSKSEACVGSETRHECNADVCSECVGTRERYAVRVAARAEALAGQATPAKAASKRERYMALGDDELPLVHSISYGSE